MPARFRTAVLRRFRRDDGGQDLIEYALLIGLVSVVAMSRGVAGRRDDSERLLVP